MAILTIHRKQMLKVGLPYWVFVRPATATAATDITDEQPVGLMRTKEVSIQMPSGTFIVGVRLVFVVWRWRFDIGGETTVTTAEGQHTHLTITDSERWWNLLFDLDLVVWMASFFFTLPTPWDIVYHVLSDGFFALWILRIIVIRRRYFKLVVSHT